MDMNSLAHTKWECKYHIVCAPKFRRKIIYGKIRADVGKILSMLCKRKGIEILEAERRRYQGKDFFLLSDAESNTTGVL